MGLDGFDNDKKKACEWHKTAHDAGHRQATAWVGNMLLEGVRTEQRIKEGMMLVGYAAATGSMTKTFWYAITIDTPTLSSTFNCKTK